MKKRKGTMTIPMTITHDAIESLLVSAIEGGSNYWYRIENTGREKKSFYERCFTKSGAKVSDYVGADGGKMVVGVVNLASMEQGLTLMAMHSPEHFSSILSDNSDATTGDVFLQYVVLGELIYG